MVASTGSFTSVTSSLHLSKVKLEQPTLWGHLYGIICAGICFANKNISFGGTQTLNALTQENH